MSLLTQNDIYKHQIVISLSVVKPRSKRKLKMFLKLIVAKLLFDMQSLLLFKFILKNSNKISQSFILCILMRTITCTTMKVFFPKRTCMLFLCLLHIQL